MGDLSNINEMEVVTDVRKQRQHIADSLDLLAYVCLLVLTMVTMWVFKKKRIWFLHESGLSVMFGLIVGAILRYLYLQISLFTKQYESSFNFTL